MASIKTIRAKKAEYEDHRQDHKCVTGKCPAATTLWLGWQRESEIWGGYKVEPEATAGLL